MNSQLRVASEADLTVQRFEKEVGALWPHVAPLCAKCAESPTPDIDELGRLLRTTAASELSPPRLSGLANDLEALVAGWTHFNTSERTVLQAAMTYLAQREDAVPDHAPDGLADDEIVVNAAVRVLLRRSRR